MFNFKNNHDVNMQEKKDFKKLAYLVNLAKGYRTINGFAADCKTNADYIADIININISSYPTVKFLEIIANNSEDRVSLKELTLACGYSNYENNDMEQIKNIFVRRGWFCYANFGDNVLDSEYGGYRLVLIIQNDVGNKHSSTTLVIPVTSKNKKILPTHISVGSNCGLQYESIVSCEQVRCISKRRLLQQGIVQKVAECPADIMNKIEIALMKAEGVLKLNINEEKVIDTLNILNTMTYENNYNYNKQRQLVFA